VRTSIKLGQVNKIKNFKKQVVMKKILLMMVMAIAYSQLQGQQTIFDLTANTPRADTCKLYAVYDLDIFKYFGLEQYDTDLRKEVFKRTVEGQFMLNEVKKKRSKMFSTMYYAVNNSFSGQRGTAIFTNYDVQRKGIYAYLYPHSDFGTANAQAPKSIRMRTSSGEMGILMKALPTETLGKYVSYEYVFLPMTEENGLEVENEKESDLEVYYFFTPSGRERVEYRFYNMGDRYWYTMTENLIKADKIRVVLANKVSGKIYSNKSYLYKAPTSSTQNTKK